MRLDDALADGQAQAHAALGGEERLEQAFGTTGGDAGTVVRDGGHNLGLVALKRDDPKSARGWFALAARESTDEKLAALAAQRLDQLPKPPASPPWSLYARGGIGYDDNVALRNDSLNTPGSGEDDTFAELLFAGSYAFLPSWRAEAAAGLLRYSDLDVFDQAAFSLGAVRTLAIDEWQLELGGYATQLSLGGDVYERSAAAAASLSKTFDQYGTLRAHLRISAVDGNGDFAGLTGTRTNFGGQYEWAWRSLNFATYLRAELNDSDDDAFASRWNELGAEASWSATP